MVMMVIGMSMPGVFNMTKPPTAHSQGVSHSNSEEMELNIFIILMIDLRKQNNNSSTSRPTTITSIVSKDLPL